MKENKKKKEKFMIETNKLTKMITLTRPEISSKVSKLYEKIRESYFKNDENYLLKYITKLYLYSVNDYLDIDETFERNKIQDIFFQVLTNNYKEEIQESIITFYCNIFQHSHNILIESTVEKGFVNILNKFIEDKEEYLIPSILQCFININYNSRYSRDKIIEVLNFETFQNYVLSQNKTIQKHSIQLIYSLCLYPIERTKFEILCKYIHHFIIQCYNKYIPTLIKSIQELIKNNFQYLKYYLENIIINKLTPIQYYEKLLQYEINDEELKIKIIQSIIELFININLEENIKIEFNYNLIIEMLLNKHFRVLFPLLRFLSNSLIKKDIQEILIDYIEEYHLIQRIIELCNDNNIYITIESIFLLTNILRFCSIKQYQILFEQYNEYKEKNKETKNIIEILISTFDLENEELIENSLICIYKMYQIEEIYKINYNIKEEILQNNIIETIENLLESENENISKNAFLFQRNIFNERKPFSFIVE